MEIGDSLRFWLKDSSYRSLMKSRLQENSNSSFSLETAGENDMSMLEEG